MQARLRVTHVLLFLTVGAANTAGAGPATAAPASAYPEYRVIVMAGANSYAKGINSAGVVIGNYAPSAVAVHAFLNRGKGLVDLGTAGATSEAVAINDKGQVLGHWTSPAGERRGFIYAAGTRRDIGAIPGRRTTYTDINNAGYITAYGEIADEFLAPQSFLRTPAGVFSNIGWLPNFAPPITYAYAINNRNRIVGASGENSIPDQVLQPFTWSRGVMRDLGAFGWSPNAALALNDCGQATGYASLREGYRTRVAVLYSNGRTIDIDGRPATVERSSAGVAINNHGHVVGASDHLAGFVYRGRRMQSLNALIDPKLGWDINDPTGINDAGQIAATAYRKGIPYAVRLDLIRPQALRTPELEADTEEGAALAPEAGAATEPGAAARSQAEAAAQAREIVRPVQQ